MAPCMENMTWVPRIFLLCLCDVCQSSPSFFFLIFSKCSLVPLCHTITQGWTKCTICGYQGQWNCQVKIIYYTMKPQIVTRLLRIHLVSDSFCWHQSQHPHYCWSSKVHEQLSVCWKAYMELEYSVSGKPLWILISKMDSKSHQEFILNDIKINSFQKQILCRKEL